MKWTRDHVLDQIDVPFLIELNAEWLSAPPERVSLAASIGYKKPEPKVFMSPAMAADWFARTGGRIDGVRKR